MGNSAFTQEEVAYLNSLPAVNRVTNGRITYTEQFKRDCARRYLHGASPAKLFREAGLDPALIGYKRVERCVARWKIRYADESEHDESSPELSQRMFVPLSKPEGPASRVSQSMTDVLLRQQSRHIDELEQQADMMRHHIAQLETVLRRRSTAAEVHVTEEFASMIAQSDLREDFVPGGGYLVGAHTKCMWFNVTKTATLPKYVSLPRMMPIAPRARSSFLNPICRVCCP